MKTVSSAGRIVNLMSSQAVVPVVVEYQYEDSHDIRKAVAYVNYGQDTVFFPNNPELDTEVMRRYLLEGFDSIFPPQPVTIPPEIARQIEQVRQGNYGYEIPGFDRS